MKTSDIKQMGRRIGRVAGLPLLAIAIFLITEFLNKRDVGKLLTFMADRPYLTSFNILIILTTLLLSELFHRRRAVLLSVSVLWLAFGIINNVIISIRIQPFTFADIVQLGDGIAIMSAYFKWYQIVLIFGASFLGVALIVLLFTKLPKEKVNYTRSALLFAAAVIACFLGYTLSIQFGALPRRFDNLVVAYEQYGFPYCFLTSVSQSGIDKPETYSGQAVDDILSQIDEEEAVAQATQEPAAVLEGAPNVIFLQLESFFDVNSVNGVSFDQNPIPVFTDLLEKWPSGKLFVPAIGGGTANTEFEVLTGMDLDFFGAGEYPYNTVLKEATCETVARNLAEEGYAATAIHNYSATFYNRNDVYAKLGFDRFVTLEYMPDATYNAKGWCMDDILTGEIEKAMRATQARDFVFTITVQTHGKYDDEPCADSTEISVLSAPEGVHQGQLTNYVNALYRTDAFLDEFLARMRAWREPVIVVMYGDHLPGVGLDQADMGDGNLYETQYVIWNNFGAAYAAEDLQAYQLSAAVLKQMGIEGGVFCRYHQNAANWDSQEYLDTLEMLEYDVLYGDMEVYGGENPYAATELMMGSVPVSVTSASAAYGRLVVRGQGFTQYSAICVGDGAMLDTIYVDKNTLTAKYAESAPGTVCVVQRSVEQGIELSRTDSVPTTG